MHGEHTMMAHLDPAVSGKSAATDCGGWGELSKRTYVLAGSLEFCDKNSPARAVGKNYAHPEHTPQLRPPLNKSGRGKSKDPDYESTTIYLRKDVKRCAMRLLLADRERGLSDVLDELLEGWIHGKIWNFKSSKILEACYNGRQNLGGNAPRHFLAER